MRQVHLWITSLYTRTESHMWSIGHHRLNVTHLMTLSTCAFVVLQDLLKCEATSTSWIKPLKQLKQQERSAVEYWAIVGTGETAGEFSAALYFVFAYFRVEFYTASWNILMSVSLIHIIYCCLWCCSVTLLVAYLMKYEGMSASQANILIQKTRPQADPYMDVLQAYSKHYLSSNTGNTSVNKTDAKITSENN